MEIESKQRGNPNFAKKAFKATADQKYDPKKRYHFQLTETQEKAKPRDKETGEMMDNPFPHIFMIANDGVGINPKNGDMERWRYIFGYNSIWITDQTKPEPGKQQLENPKNFIEFKKGSLFVMGTNTALLDTMHIQDIFEGVESPVNPVPPKYKLVDENKSRKLVRDQADLSYEAEKAARETEFEELLPIAMLFGIDIDNPEENEERIRTEMIFKAKQSPDVFSKQFVNPKTKFKYHIVQAMRKGLISDSIIPGKMCLVDTQKPFFDAKEGDVAEQFAGLLMIRHEGATKLYDQILILLSAE